MSWAEGMRATLVVGVMSCATWMVLSHAAVAVNIATAAAAVHKAKPLKTLRTSSGTWQPSAAGGHAPTSPYARAAAQRDDSGAVPPGHAHVLQRPVPGQASVH